MNLGCGLKVLAGYVNVDNEPSIESDIQCELGRDRWPWPDSSVDEAIASHVLEHLPGDEFFWFLRELYRVSKPGAKTRITLPHPRHDIFLGDPTHCRPVMPGTMVMFSKHAVEGVAARGMSLTPFYKIHGVDFKFSDLEYQFDPSVNMSAPDLEWQAKHLSNIIMEWSATLTAVKC